MRILARLGAVGAVLAAVSLPAGLTHATPGGPEVGSTIQEPAGTDHVHIGENRETTDVVLEVLYVLPHGAPFSEDAPDPGCAIE
ncbi:hypothetical protein SAMN05444521_0743 [Streptomyces sp. 3214.6]|nr:hypothetical protein [Streptomyces sp. 3214.6]SHH50353.1 hypothetical protein SAMN05444521_0743 [Streptomyces sp. 3214.6]